MVYGVCGAESIAIRFYKLVSDDVDTGKIRGEKIKFGGYMNNVLEGIPYQEQKMGARKLIDEKCLLMMQAALKPAQSVPQHAANSNVHILVVKGEVVIDLNGVEILAKEGSLVPIAYKTSMNVTNKSDRNASFLIIKTPNPSEMVDK